MADGMDSETQAYIDAQKRPLSKSEPHQLSGRRPEPAGDRRVPLPELEASLKAEREAAGAVPLSSPDEPAAPVDLQAYARSRGEREHQRVVASLDRIAPAHIKQLPNGTPVFVCEVPCGNCGQTVECTAPGFEETETAGALRARMIAAGWLRSAPVPEGGRFSGVMCDGCVKSVEAEEAERRILNEQGARLSDACLPKAMQGFRFEEMHLSGYAENDRKLAVEASRHWASTERVESKPGLLLFGTKGAGKSRLAATAAFQRLRRWPVRWVSWPALAGQLLGSFDDEDRKVAMSVLNGTGALVLDDIARDDVSVSDWTKNQLFVAIDKRVQAGTPILITTNLTGTTAEPENPMAAIGERLGASIASRLAGYCRVVELPGDDMRLVFDFEGRRQGMSKAELQAAREGLQHPEERE